ncbi:wall-associated receptor kinase-like 20 [Populus alba x Populus x berolinensis]|nr:wall-associated receptor kinase-like 20 [Populus alba x Populus x berolinensis]
MCTFSAKNCPNCGTTPVPYPFSTASTCGDPQYKIRCNSGTLLFDTLNTSYPIMSINPSIQRLVIQPASLYQTHVSRLNTSTKWSSPGLAIEWVLPQEPVWGLRPTVMEFYLPARCISEWGQEVLLYRWTSLDPIQGICAHDATCQNDGSCGGSTKTALIAGLTSGIGLTLLVIVISVLLYKRRRRIKEAQERLAREREEILNAGGSRAAKIFTGKQIKKATNNFSKDRLLGAGGYGEVFKGILDDGTVVAVKCAKLGNTKGTDQVLNEVRILCQVNHKSLVCLLGCCVELQQPILVYEYIENGNLLDRLQGLKPDGKSQLSWLHRLQIAHDTADGLAYLHFSAVPSIYHRDVKSSNILLDEKLNAKVSDFGLSRLAHSDLSHISTCAQGTLGYLDPEYYRKYQLTDKSDVYSFGVVLLELLTSQKALDFTRPEDDINLAVYVQRMTEEEKLMDVIDPFLKVKASSLQLETVKALAFLALSCIEEKRQNRPSMKEVAEEIEYITTIATAREVEN